MVIKKHLPVRLKPALIAKLARCAKAVNAPIDETISLALDALIRNRSMTESDINGADKDALTFAERLEFLEQNLTDLVGLMTVFNNNVDRHFSEAGALEKERLGALYRR